MKRIMARQLLMYPIETLWNSLAGEFILVMDDGEILTNARAVLYSSYFWEYHRVFPNTPLLLKHHVESVLKGKSLSANTHTDLLSNIYIDVINNNDMADPAKRQIPMRMVYQITNNLYNDLIIKCRSSIVSIDILDFIEVLEQPEVSKAMATVVATPESIEETYNIITNTLMNSPALKENLLSIMVKSKLVNRNQVLQCLGPRGYPTDINSVIFPTPILRGYTQGLRSMHDLMIESRSCAKSLFFAEQPLQDAEYFARRLQLLAMTVENVHYNDCGSEEYLVMRVKPPIYENGKMVYEGDLENMIGKYYLDEESNTIKCITRQSTHLNDKMIKIRSVTAGCKHPDPAGLCYICLGKLADNVTNGTNIGHASGATLTQQTSQSVLSTKHLDGSSVLEPIMLDADARPFFIVNQDTSSYHMNPDVLSHAQTVKLIVADSDLFGLNDINLIKNVRDISISRISKIDTVSVEITNGDITESYPVSVLFKGRYGMLTHEFLEYIKEFKWRTDSLNNAVFDITSLPNDVPIITLPNKQYSMSDHSASVANIIEARIADLTERGEEATAAGTLIELFDTVNDKLKVNLSLLDVLIYSAMVISGENNNYGLPKPGTTKGLGVTTRTIPNRSLSAAYAFEDVYETITKPKSFFDFGRPSHPMDVYVMPKEAVEDFKNR